MVDKILFMPDKRPKASPEALALSPEEIFDLGGPAIMVMVRADLFPGLTPYEAAAAMTDRLLSHYRQQLESLGVLDGLTDEQRFRLTDSVTSYSHLFHSAAHSVGNLSDTRNKWVQTAARDSPAQARKLLTKLKALNSKLEECRDYLEYHIKKGGQTGRPNEFFARGLDQTITRPLHEAAKVLATMDYALLELEAKKQGEKRRLASPRTRLRQQATVSLHDYFAGSCGLPNNEAQRRTAVIGNALWDWNVKVTHRYDHVVDWKGSVAVRKRIARQSHGRSRKNP